MVDARNGGERRGAAASWGRSLRPAFRNDRHLADVLNIAEIKNLGIRDEHLDRNENDKFQAVIQVVKGTLMVL